MRARNEPLAQDIGEIIKCPIGGHIVEELEWKFYVHQAGKRSLRKLDLCLDATQMIAERFLRWALVKTFFVFSFT